jgi:trimeric autotransporter adhesin
MKNPTLHLCLALLLSLILLACTAAYGQLTPSGDAYTNTATPTTNYGAKTLLDVESSQTTFIQFDLSSIPSGYTSADITKATLKLYVNAVTTAGSFNVDYVNGTWTESTIDSSNAPALGTTIAASVPLTTKDKNQYVLVDVTAAVQAWLSGTPNDGIALVANSPLNASFDSKESTSTSHSAELDIVFAAGSGGGITGITTTAGSGLIGGGTSGTLNLSLTNTCATKQILQWSGSAWVCAAAGTGTITGVTAGTDLTGGGTSGNVTLSLNTAATNALYAQLGAANTFSTQQTATVGTGDGPAIYGNQTGAGIGVVGQTVNVFGIAGQETGTAAGSAGVFGQAVAPGGYGVQGTNFAQTGNAVGVYGTSSSTSGYGVEGLVGSPTGYGVAGSNTATSGFAAGVAGSTTSSAGYGVLGQATSSTGSGIGVYGWSGSEDGYGVFGSSNNIGVFGNASTTNISTVGAPYGVLGSSSTVGVYGASSGVSTTAGSVIHNNGVWGDYGGAAPGIGVLGTADNNYAGIFYNNSSSPAVTIGNLTSTAGGEVFVAWMPHLLGENSAAIIGDPGCAESNGNTGLQLGQNGMSGCTNYTLLGNNVGGTYLNANSGQTLHLRVDNTDQLTVTSGTVNVVGTLSKGGGSFKIDHPLDPANKYLYHSFVESPDMKNIYDGTITTDGAGLATVTLPDWFESLNRDFRYQLTVIGQFAQAIVASKVANNQFRIQTDKPNVEVSWQVTGIRQDAFANANRIPVEAEKAPTDRGHYLYPEAIGLPTSARIGYEAPPPGSDRIVHHGRPNLLRGNASPARTITLPSPPKRVLPNVAPLPPITPLPHPVQASRPEVNQK